MKHSVGPPRFNWWWRVALAPGDGIHGCLIFRVSPSDQPVADSNGVWIDLPTCQAAAAGYPGGADCVTQ